MITETRKDLLKFGVVCALLFAGGVAFIRLYPREWPLRETMVFVAHALVVASVLALSVDVYLKARLLKEVMRHTARYLIGYELPAEIQDRIHEIMGTALVRHRYEQRCRLTRLETGQVKVDVDVTWDMLNYSGTPCGYAPPLHFHKYENPEFAEICCETMDSQAAFALSGEGLRRHIQDAEDFITVKVKKISIQPRSAGIKYRIRVRYSVAPDVPLYFTAMAMPTIGVLVRVEAPEALKPRIVAMAKETLHQGNCWEWRQLFMPGEHFTLRWEQLPPVAR
jgi:hypothetical protein